MGLSLIILISFAAFTATSAEDKGVELLNAFMGSDANPAKLELLENHPQLVLGCFMEKNEAKGVDHEEDQDVEKDLDDINHDFPLIDRMKAALLASKSNTVSHHKNLLRSKSLENPQNPAPIDLLRKAQSCVAAMANFMAPPPSRPLTKEERMKNLREIAEGLKKWWEQLEKDKEQGDFYGEGEMAEKLRDIDRKIAHNKLMIKILKGKDETDKKMGVEKQQKQGWKILRGLRKGANFLAGEDLLPPEAKQETKQAGTKKNKKLE